MTLQNMAARYWVFAMERQPPAEQLADIALHRDLARAIAAGDPAQAEAAMARLIGDPPSLASGPRLRDAAGAGAGLRGERLLSDAWRRCARSRQGTLRSPALTRPARDGLLEGSGRGASL